MPKPRRPKPVTPASQRTPAASIRQEGTTFTVAKKFREAWEKDSKTKALMIGAFLMLIALSAALFRNKYSENNNLDLLDNSDLGPAVANTNVTAYSDGLLNAMSAIIIARDSADRTTLGWNNEEFEDYVQRQRLRVREKLIDAANPAVLEHILRSPGHAIVVKHPRAQANFGSFYRAERNIVAAGIADETTDSSHLQQMRNEYFHASTCVKRDGTLIKEVEKCLSPTEVQQLDDAIQQGHHFIKQLELHFKVFQKKLLTYSKAEPNAELKKFFAALESYEDFPGGEYASASEFQSRIRTHKFKKLPDGRFFSPAGSYILNGHKTTADLYITATPAKDLLFLSYSYLQDNSVTAKARAFFANFHLREIEYHDEEGEYGKVSHALKVANYGSDFAMLSTAMKEFVNPRFCRVMEKITGFSNYCVIPEDVTVKCEITENQQTACSFKPR